MTDACSDVPRLQALAMLGLLDTASEERFDRIARIAQRVFDVPTVLVTLLDEDRQFHKARLGFDAGEIPRSQSFCDRTIRDDVPFVVDDASQDATFRDNPLVTGKEHVRFYAGQPLRTPSGVNVGALCLLDKVPRRLSEIDLSTLRDLADLVEEEFARTDELERASQVQRGLLPRTVPRLPGYEVAGACQPAAAVGGDFYDWYTVPDGFHFVLADVMGKGIGAAIIGSSIRSLWRGASRLATVEAAVEQMAADLEEDLSSTSTFVTLFTARLDLATHQLRFVDAGHGLAAVVTRDGDLVPCQSDALPLGAPRFAPYTSDRVTLNPGDTVVCVSDGLLDLFDTLPAAREALREAVVAAAGVDDLVSRVTAFGRRSKATDDVTVVAVKRRTEE